MTPQQQLEQSARTIAALEPARPITSDDDGLPVMPDYSFTEHEANAIYSMRLLYLAGAYE